MVDFSCIPCAGGGCFTRQVADRQACSLDRHPCPFRVDNRDWRCRCCADCTKRCLNQQMAMADVRLAEELANGS